MGQVCELIVGKDQDIKGAIEAFVLEKGWQNVYISGASGSVYGVEFTAPADGSYPPKVERTLCQGPGEMLAFTGEVMTIDRMDPALKGVYQGEGPLFIHIHASVATAGAHVYGGGFQTGKAFRSLKVYLQEV